MKKAFILVTAVILLLSACSTGNKESKVLTSETQLSETTTSTVETTAETLATKTYVPPIDFKGTIRTGTKLDTAEFDKVGPLIDGKVITFKNIGEPYFKTSYYDDEAGNIINWSFSEQEIGYINCKTSEKVTLCKIKPIADAKAYVYLDSTYAYVIYMKLPEGKTQSTLSQAEYKNLVTKSNFTVLRINVKTNETKEYTMKTTRQPNFSLDNIIEFEVKILGEDNLMITYTEEVNENADSFNRISDCLNLSSGETSNFGVSKFGKGINVHDDESFFCIDTNEDKLFSYYRKFIDNEWIYRFNVYDTNLKLIDEIEVARDSESRSDGYMVDDNNIYYSFNDGTAVKKYAYKNGSYISVPTEKLPSNKYLFTVFPNI